jgi:integrase
MVIEGCRTDSLQEARRQAKVVNEGLARNPAARFARANPVTVEVAIAETLAAARTSNPETRRVLEVTGRYFRTFLGQRFPGIRLWAQVTNGHLEAWARELVGKKLARKTLSNYVAVVVQVSRHMAAAHPMDRIYFPLVAPGAEVAKGGRARAVDYLDWPELLALADYAHGQDLRVEAAVLLSGVCGLRLSEIATLSADAVDFRSGTLTVGRSKNAAGLRTIPLPRIVLDRLQAQVEATPGPWLIEARAQGRDGQGIQIYRIGELIRPIQKQAARDGAGAHVAKVQAKDLRKTAFNLLKAAGVDPEYRRAYCGHAEGSTAARHYEDRNSPRMVARLKAEVVDRLEAYLERQAASTSKKVTRPVTA